MRIYRAYLLFAMGALAIMALIAVQQHHTGWAALFALGIAIAAWGVNDD